MKNSNQKILRCKYCEASFRYKSEIKRHILQHIDEKPYRCSYPTCNKAFKRSDTLLTHNRIHTNERPYLCDFKDCDLSFKSKSALRYHILKH